MIKLLSICTNISAYIDHWSMTSIKRFLSLMRAVEGYFAPAEILGENGMTETRSKRHPPSEIERIHHILQYGGPGRGQVVPTGVAPNR